MPRVSLKKARVRFMLFILAFMCPMILPAQSSIEGVVRDARENLPFVTVVLQNADSVFIEGLVTDSAGGFVFGNVSPGYYQVAASRVGYSRFLSGRITVSANQKIRLPEIVLEEVSTFLETVEVQGEKQLFDQRADRLVINPQSSLTFAGNTVLEVLRKSPGILVNRQDGSISMNGRSGVRVMINDRIMELPPEAVAQMLDAMSSANVERIELITAPPASYDAQGTAGIIRILTKKDLDTGTNAAFGATLGASWAETLRANFNLYHRNQHVAYFVDYAVLRNHNLHLMDTRWESPGLPLRADNDSHRENITTRHSFNTGFEWQCTDHTNVSLLLSGYTNSWNLDAFTNDAMRGDSTVFTTMKIKELNNWGSATASAGLQRKAGPQGELNLLLDYLYYNNNNPSRYNNTVVNEQNGGTEYSEIALDKTTPITILIGRADYRFRVSASLSGEAGVKGVTSSLDNSVRVQQLKNNSWIA
ncbi:MAG TPA: TonB-dependent receptor, partial [Chryseosolibacter sp.]